MKISPRYDMPCIAIDTDLDELRSATLRQRRRAVESFGRLTDEQWTSPSRCDGWAARDVVAHLVDTDRYWDASIKAGLDGEPSRFLDGFDPVATPAAMVAALTETPVDTLLARYASSAGALCTTIESLDEAGWRSIAEAPPGHLPTSVVVHHALWDSWVHERDALVPLGIDVPVEHDEVLACLRYAAALGPAFGLSQSDGRSGLLEIRVVDLETTFTVEVDDSVRVSRGPVDQTGDRVCIEGTALALAEMFSVRAPFDLPDPGDGAWLLAGLATVFDQAAPAE